MYLTYLQSTLNYFKDLQLEFLQKIALKRVKLESKISIINQLYFLYIQSDKITQKKLLLEM